MPFHIMSTKLGMQSNSFLPDYLMGSVDGFIVLQFVLFCHMEMDFLLGTGMFDDLSFDLLLPWEPSIELRPSTQVADGAINGFLVT